MGISIDTNCEEKHSAHELFVAGLDLCSKKGNGLGLVLSFIVVRSSRAAEGGTGEAPALALGTSLGMG